MKIAPNFSEEKVSENDLDHSKELLAPEALIDLEDEIHHGIVRYETLQKKQNTMGVAPSGNSKRSGIFIP